MFAPLRHTGFRSLVLLYVLNSVLEWFGAIALMVVVYAATGSPIAAAGLLICSQVVPGLVVPRLGDRLDRLPVRRGLTILFSVQAAVFATVASIGFSALVFPLAVVIGAASALARGVMRGAVGRALRGRDLRAGNALLNMVSGLALPLAPALAALVIAATSGRFALGIVGAGLAATTGLALLLTRRLAHGATDAPSDDESTTERATASPVPVGWWIALGAIATGLSVIDEPSLLAFSTEALAGGVGGYGVIVAAQGVGLSVGGLLFSRLLDRPMHQVYGLAAAMIGVAFLGMALAPTVAVAAAFALLLGAGIGMDWVAIVTAVQEATPGDRQASVMARLESAGMAGPGVGLLLGGLIAEVGSPRLALAAPGLLALAVVAVGAALIQLRLRAADDAPLLAPIPGGSS